MICSRESLAPILGDEARITLHCVPATSHALAPAVRPRTTRSGAPKDGLSHADLPRDVEPIDTSFLRKPPPSWGEGWNWGRPTARARQGGHRPRALAKRHRRTPSWPGPSAAPSTWRFKNGPRLWPARNSGMTKWEMGVVMTRWPPRSMDAKLSVDYLCLLLHPRPPSLHGIPCRGKGGHWRSILLRWHAPTPTLPAGTPACATVSVLGGSTRRPPPRAPRRLFRIPLLGIGLALFAVAPCFAPPHN